MQRILALIQGDKTIWALLFAFAVISFIPVYSASSNLAYLYGSGDTMPFVIKHAAHLLLGFVFMFFIHRLPFHYFGPLSRLFLPLAIFGLVYTLLQGNTIAGANASRWIQIPILGFTIQTSAFAGIVLCVYVAQYISKNVDKSKTLKASVLPLWLPVFVVIGLIFPANFSTSALLFFFVLVIAFIGCYPLKQLLTVLGVALLGALLFILVAKAFPSAFPDRVDTWFNRVENFMTPENTETDYQVTKAKTAIASGGVIGKGPGKSVQKNFLPQSSSDFIYAIIVEELGLVGGMALLGLYLILLFRLVVALHKAPTLFGKILIVAAGLPIIVQAFVNMGVAVSLLPVTGQTLPLISSGGSSIWVTCIAMGMVLSVTAKHVEKQTDIESDNPLDILSEAL